MLGVGVKELEIGTIKIIRKNDQVTENNYKNMVLRRQVNMGHLALHV